MILGMIVENDAKIGEMMMMMAGEMMISKDEC